MKLAKSAGLLLALACLYDVSAQMPDTLWACRDSIADSVIFYSFIGLCDTNVVNQNCYCDTCHSAVSMADTGERCPVDTFHGGKYVNFDYQFTTSPGASFKIFWDDGHVTFNVSGYDSMCFWHKGPLPGHKVRLIWAQGGVCGGAINYQDFGEFKSSAEWTQTTLPFPPGFVKNGIFELRVLVWDDSSVTTSPTSVMGNLKLNDIGFIRASTAGVSNPGHTIKTSGDPRFFVPRASGRVTLAIYSLQGEQLFKKAVDVTAGRSYRISQFAQRNSNLPSGWIQCVKITGAGINIVGKNPR